MQAALQVLSKFRRLAESHSVDEIVAVATSAVREAENGGEFLKTVAVETGIRPRVISGTEEARLIHMAAAYGVGAAGEVLVVIDIGGGSVEITRGAGPTMEIGRSFKLGVIRLTERFVKSDPISPREERKLVRHIDAEVGEHIQRIKRAGFDRVVGTSGTILSLGAIAAGHQGRGGPATLRNRRVSAKQLHRVRRTMTSPRSREARAGAWARAAARRPLARRRGAARHARAPPGADEITLCDLSLREGVVLDYIARHRKEIAQADRYPDVRRRSVVELGERCSYWPEHAQQIARLSTALFDQTRAIHGLTDKEREWLEYAATPARHRRAYQLRAPPQALRVPDPQRRPARVRARRDRDHRARRPLSPARHAQEAARRASRVLRPAPPDHPDAGGDPAARRKPRSQPRADDQRRRAPRPRRGRPAAAADQERRRARAVGGEPPRRPVRAPPQEAASSRSEQDHLVC